MTDLVPSLVGKRIVVTGASRGIGAAIAERLGALNATVIRVARSSMPALEGAFDHHCDLSDPGDRDRTLAQITVQHGIPDGVVSNAGAFRIAPIEETTDAMVREQLAINLEAPFAIARHFLPQMRQRGYGVHVLIGSVADAKPFPGNAAYSASKYGARGLHEVLCEEFHGSGVRCTLISPAATDTTVWDPINPDLREGFTPRSRMLRPADVAESVITALTAPRYVQIESIRLRPV